MDKIIRKFTYTITALLAVMVFIFSSYVGGGVGVSYAATSTTYSNVLEDLSKDETFNAAYYPEVADDYSLQVIQIAESSDGELFIYVYQPSGQTVDLRASKISISMAINENFYPRLYSLTYLNAEGVLYKYKVEDIILKTSVQRYYEIPEIFRKFDSNLGDTTVNDNAVFEVSYSVGQLWTVTTTTDGIDYVSEIQDVVTITNKWNSFILYDDGYYITHTEKTVCNFIAFDCDYDIDYLLEADIVYATQSFSQNFKNGTAFEPQYGEVSEFKYLTLHYDDYGTNVNISWLGAKTTWQRIQSIDDFLTSESDILSASAKTELSDKKWVLRYYDTTYNTTSSIDNGGNYWSSVSYERVYEVSILRLKFQIGKDTYNLGVVDNITGVSEEPAGESRPNSNIDWKKIFAIVLDLLVLILLFVIGMPVIVPVLGAILKAVLWVVCLPFKLIAKLFKKKE